MSKTDEFELDLLRKITIANANARQQGHTTPTDAQDAIVGAIIELNKRVAELEHG